MFNFSKKKQPRRIEIPHSDLDDLLKLADENNAAASGCNNVTYQKFWRRLAEAVPEIQEGDWDVFLRPGKPVLPNRPFYTPYVKEIL